MALSPSSHSPVVTLITPECNGPGGHITGNQYTMVRGRQCSGWFCSLHIAAQQEATLVHPAPRVQSDLAYYQGICVACWQEGQ
jgi:hypothetical protein